MTRSRRVLVAATLISLAALQVAAAEPRRKFEPWGIRGALPAPIAAKQCTDLASLSWMDGSRVTGAVAVPATTGDATYSPLLLKNLPAFCRVAGEAMPTKYSLIKFEVWIPIDGSYRGRYLQVGNGGFSGIIPYFDLADGLRRGYAVAGTDDGSQTPPYASFASIHWEKIVDYGHRALKQTTDKAKDIVRSLTGESPSKSYFHGCSNGGRQALMEAQRYPNDFDGIIAGAPANYFTHQFASFKWNTQLILDPGSETPKLTPSRVAVLSKAVRAQCAGKDGGLTTDRFLTNPLACKVKLSAIICPPFGGDKKACLTQSEGGIVQRLYAGPDPIFPGLEPGAEDFKGNWPDWITGPTFGAFSAQAAFAGGFFGSFVNRTAGAADVRVGDVHAEIGEIDDNFAETLNSTNPDLSAFFGHGGKLIHYHGFDDAAVAPKNSINYWASVSAKMNELQPGFNLAARYRLFMVPGLAHCLGGPGATVLLGNPATGERLDAQHDLFAAIERWGEQNQAPPHFVASHISEDIVRFQRPVCPYPEMPRYKGTGDTSLTSNWSCGLAGVKIPYLPKFIPHKPFRVPLPPDPSPLRKKAIAPR